MNVTLLNRRHAESVVAQALEEMLPGFADGKQYQLSIKIATRGLADNAHYHAIIGQIAKRLPVNDEKVSAEDMKRLLISAFKIETQDDPDYAKEWAKFGELRQGVGFRGEAVTFGEQSRKFSTKLAKAFIHWLNAFAAEHEITLMAPKSWEEDR